jgi:hypothetical protein
VMGQSPGPMELLPNQFYNGGKPWLHMKQLMAFDLGKEKMGSDGRLHPVMQRNALSLPKSDPYKEIYGDRNAWYRLVDEGFLNPIGDEEIDKIWATKPPKEAQIATNKIKEGAWTDYLKVMETAKTFHATINTPGQEFHPCTYAYYGDDPKYRSFESVSWSTTQPINIEFSEDMVRAGQRLENDAEGTLRVDFFKSGHPELVKWSKKGGPMIPHLWPFTVSGHDAAGDGTVPTRSGEAVKNYPQIRASFRMKGFDHQMSYADRDARLVTLYSIVSIVKEKAFDDIE